MTWWKLLGSALIVGAVLVVVLDHEHSQKTHPTLNFPVSEEKAVSEPQKENPAPVANPENTEPASPPQPAEQITTPLAQQEERVASPAPELSQDPPNPVLQSPQIAPPTTHGPDKSKSTSARKKKVTHKSAKQRRPLHYRTRHVTYIPERRNYHYGFPAVSN